MQQLSNVSLEYVQLRVKFFEGDNIDYLRELGVSCYKKYYAGKVFKPMVDLIKLLKENGFEVWIITASPEAMYQKFLSEELQIPITNIVGIKSVVRGGIITGTMVEPIAQDHGKKEAIETFVQAQPLLVGGNSRGDKEMIEYSKNLKLIINPDEHVAEDQTESIAEYARTMGRVEGHIAFEERRIAEEKHKVEQQEGAPIPYKEARHFWDELTRILDKAEDGGDTGPLREGLKLAQALLRKFIERHRGEGGQYEPDTKELDRLIT